MMKIKTRLLAMLLAGFMIAETCPITAFGAELPPTDTTTLTEPSDPLTSQDNSDTDADTESPLESQLESEVELPDNEENLPIEPNTSTVEEEEPLDEEQEELDETSEALLEETDQIRLSLDPENAKLTVYFSSFSSDHNYTARLLKIIDAEHAEELSTWTLSACKPDAESGICAQTLSLTGEDGGALTTTGESYQLQLVGGDQTQVQNFTPASSVSDLKVHLSNGSFDVSWTGDSADSLSGYRVQLFAQKNLLTPLASAQADADASSAALSANVPEEAFVVAVTPRYTVGEEDNAPTAQGETIYTTSASIDTPESLTAEAGDAAVTLRFRPVDVASGYNIYRNGTLLTSVSAKGLAADEDNPDFVVYEDKTALNGVSYQYQVQALLTIGMQEIKEEVTFKSGVVANTASVYVREGPSTSSAILKTLLKGKAVTVIGESGDFYKVEGGGYISKIRVNIQEVSTIPVTISLYDQPITGVIYNTSSVYVRMAPTTESPALDTLKKGVSVSVRGESGDFYALEDGGYISKIRVQLSQPISAASISTLTEGPAEAITYAYAVAGTIVNTASVYIRQGPSTSTAALGTLKKGAAIEVLGEEGDFYRTADGYISKIRVQLKEAPVISTPNTPESFGENQILSELSAQSESVTPVIVVPGDVQNLATQIGDKSITISWDPVASADYYQIYRYDEETDSFVELATSTTNSYRNTGLTSGTTYQYQVQAIHEAGGQTAKGPISEAISETASVMPGKVTNLKATVKETSVMLTWSKQTNASGYRVFTYDPETKEKTEVADTTALTYTLEDLTNNQKYYFVVCAYRTVNGEKRLTDQTSDTVSATPKILTPAKPSNFKAVNGDECVNLTWSRAANATTYEIYRKEIGVDAEFKLLTTFPKEAGTFPTTGTIVNTDSVYIRQEPNTSSTVLGTLKRGESIQVLGEEGDFYTIDGGYVSKLRVQLMNVSGAITGTIANTESVYIRQGPSTSSATLGTLKKGEKVQVIGESGDFYLTTVGYVSKARVNLSSSATSSYAYVDDNLPNGKQYQYQIRGVRTSGGQTVYSDYVTSSTVTTAILPPPAPTDVELKQTDTTNTLTWTPARKAEFYRVYLYNSKTGKYDQLIGDNLTECTFTHTIPASSTTYYKYKIVSCRMVEGEVLESVTGASKNCYALQYAKKISSVRTIQYSIKLKSKSPYFSSASSSSQLGTLSSGTRATELMRSNGRSKLKLSNGNQVWVSTSRLSRLSQNYNSKTSYSAAIAEAWVNSKGYSSPTSYLIWINQYTQRVYIFKGSKNNWKLYKSCLTATGKASTPTPMTTKAVWGKDRGWYDAWTYEIYCTKWYSVNAFHSRVKTYGGGYSDSRIGSPISNGCCRMYDSDCKWIYQNIPLKTTVVSF